MAQQRQAAQSDQPDLTAIARAASREAGGVPPDLLSDYLPAVLDAARTGRRLMAAELARYGWSGEQAAEHGVALRGLVDLYLSATWRLWRELPEAGKTAGLGVLRAADDAVQALAEGFERAHYSIARREESERLEFVDDLLSGRGGADLVARGERLGLSLAGPHLVVLAGDAAGADQARPLGKELDRLVATAAAPSPSLTAVRAGRLVAVTGVADGGEATRVAAALARVLGSGPPEPAPTGPRPWRVAYGRPYPGRPGCGDPTTRPVTRWTWPTGSAGLKPWWTPLTCCSIKSCCATGRPLRIWWARCSSRWQAPGAAPGRCWKRCRHITRAAGSRRRRRVGCTCPPGP